MIKESEIPYQEVYKSSINPKTRTLYKELLYGVLKSAECELDVVNEVYLMSVQARKEKELLFFSENDNELNIKMKDNIKNIKRNPEKQNIIFHIAENLGTGKEQRIDAFGSDVFRLYLWSKDFRNLFVETDKVYDKYSFNEILRILDSGVDKKILTRKPETSIIIEKILGLTGVQCMNCFIGDLLNKVNVINVKEREDGQLEIENTIIDMVKELWNISGEYSRVLMMQLIYWELKYSQTSIGEPGSTGGRIAIGNKENEQRAIALYTKLLKEVKKVFNLYYGKIVKAVWEEYRKVYSPKALAELLKEKDFDLYGKNKIKQLIYKYYQDIEKQETRNKNKSSDIKTFICTYIIPVIAFFAGRINITESSAAEWLAIGITIIIVVVSGKYIGSSIIELMEMISWNQLEKEKHFVLILQDLLDRDFVIEQDDLIL